MLKLTSSLTLTALLFLGASCSRTELMLGFATDLKAKNQIDHVHLDGFRDGVVFTQLDWDLSDVPAGEFELPGSLGLFSDGGEPRMELTLTGTKGAAQTPVAVRHAVVSLIKNKTLFMRMTLVAECGGADAPACPSGQVCIEGVCRAVEVDARRLPEFKQEYVKSVQCTSGIHYIVSSSGTPMAELPGGCAASEMCQEGTCYRAPALASAVGASTWTPAPAPSSSPASDGAVALHAVWADGPSDQAYAVGDGGTVLYRSSLSGAWTSLADSLPAGVPTLWGLFANSSRQLWAVGQDGAILTRDPERWTLTQVPDVARLSGVWSNDGVTLVVGRSSDGSGVVLRESGQSLSPNSWFADRSFPSGSPELRAIWGSNLGNVWVVGAHASVFHYSAEVWQKVALPAGTPDVELLAVTGTENGDVYAVGRGGVVIHIGKDGKAERQSIADTLDPALGGAVDLNGVWASGPRSLYVVGDLGLILHSDGSGRWTRQESGTRQPLLAVAGGRPNHVWTAGRGGVTLHLGPGSNCTSDDGCPADAFCGAGHTCEPRRGQGDTCAAVDCAAAGCRECQSGSCVDGYCCDGTCGGQCQACDVFGAVGTCTTLKDDYPHGSRAQCHGEPGQACRGRCEGSSATGCGYPARGTLGALGTCSSANLHTLSGATVCDGDGGGQLGDVDCGLYACNVDHCNTSCTPNGRECASDRNAFCSNGVCIQSSKVSAAPALMSLPR